MTCVQTDRQFRALQTAFAYEAGERVYLDKEDSEICRAKGWLEAVNGGYLLTDAGRSVLAASAGATSSSQD
jgi:hypothetical protein